MSADLRITPELLVDMLGLPKDARITGVRMEPRLWPVSVEREGVCVLVLEVAHPDLTNGFELAGHFHSELVDGPHQRVRALYELDGQAVFEAEVRLQVEPIA